MDNGTPRPSTHSYGNELIKVPASTGEPLASRSNNQCCNYSSYALNGDRCSSREAPNLLDKLYYSCYDG